MFIQLVDFSNPKTKSIKKICGGLDLFDDIVGKFAVVDMLKINTNTGPFVNRIPFCLCLLITIASLIFLSTNMLTQFSEAQSNDLDMDIWVYHGGEGTAEICLSSKGYERDCNEYDLTLENNPFIQPYRVDDPESGKEFSVCYEIEETNQEGCDDFEFERESQQIEIHIPGQNSIGNQDQIDNSADNMPTVENSEIKNIGDDGNMSTNPSLWQSYKDSRFDFEFRYPEDWTVEKFTLPVESGYNMAANLCPKVDYIDSFPGGCLGSDKLTIIGVDRGVSDTLPDFVDDELVQLQSDFDNFLVVDRRDSTFMGSPAIQVSYTAESSFGEFMHTVIWSKVGISVYSVDFISNPMDNPDYPPPVKGIVESFKISA